MQDLQHAAASLALHDKICINELMVQAIVGVNPSERVNKQNIVINITMLHDVSACAAGDDVSHTINYASVCKAVVKYTEESHHYTLESLCTNIARICCIQYGAQGAIVKIDKPCVLSLARSPSVEIYRSREFFLNQEKQQAAAITEQQSKGVEDQAESKFHTAFLALGSNIGNRQDHLYKALKMLTEFCEVISTSALYQTPPAYVLDQPAFLNAVCKVRTKLTPTELLNALKDTEQKIGRTNKEIRWGPRCIDLDILFYEDVHTHAADDSLIIPHPRIPERDFVLGPLNDIAPEFVHPVLKKTVSKLFSELPQHKLNRVIPVRSRLWELNQRTFVMGILNATPDSFSDGGNFNDVQHAVNHAKEMVESGVDIIDIGGQSTRPRATLISPEEELNRVVPIIKALRSDENPWMKDIPISIDTFYSEVAEAAVKAGADVINDVFGGNYDEKIVKVAHEHQVPIILMHLRGNPQTMLDTVNTTYENLVEDVARFLRQRAETLQAAGIPRWNIVLDPGIGMAKTSLQSLEVLGRFSEMRKLMGESYATLVGASRKNFIGRIIGGEAEKEAKKRGWGTAATTCAAIAGGAHIVRVHDVKEQSDVAKVADAIYLHNFSG